MLAFLSASGFIINCLSGTKRKEVTASTEASSKVEETNEKRVKQLIRQTNKRSSIEFNESVKSEETDENNSQLTTADLDTTAINAGDFTTLVGTWKMVKERV